MKKITCLFIFLVLVFSAGAAAASDGAAKPKVAVLFNETFTESQKLRQEAKKIFLDKLSQKFSTNYDITIDGGFSDKLLAAGFNEPILAERGDLVPVFKAGDVDYAVIVYGSNYASNYSAILTGGGYCTFIYYIQLKVIDVNQNKSLFVGQFNLEKGTTTLLKRHVEELYTEAEKALIKVLPLN